MAALKGMTGALAPFSYLVIIIFSLRRFVNITPRMSPWGVTYQTERFMSKTLLRGTIMPGSIMLTGAPLYSA
jgi:hypothetical protein